MANNDFKQEKKRIELVTWLYWFCDQNTLESIYQLEKDRIEYQRKKEIMQKAQNEIEG
jgi:hypothetical protein